MEFTEILSLGVSLTRCAIIRPPLKLVASNRSRPRLYFSITNLRVVIWSLFTMDEYNSVKLSMITFMFEVTLPFTMTPFAELNIVSDVSIGIVSKGVMYGFSELYNSLYLF